MVHKAIVCDRKKGKGCVVVCETQRDEKEILAQATIQGLDSTNLVTGEGDYPITLNEFEL